MYCEFAVGASWGDLGEDGDDEAQGVAGSELVEGFCFRLAWVALALLGGWGHCKVNVDHLVQAVGDLAFCWFVGQGPCIVQGVGEKGICSGLLGRAAAAVFRWGVRLARFDFLTNVDGVQAGVAGRWALAFAHSACADGSDDRVCVCGVLG